MHNMHECTPTDKRKGTHQELCGNALLDVWVTAEAIFLMRAQPKEFEQDLWFQVDGVDERYAEQVNIKYVRL